MVGNADPNKLALTGKEAELSFKLGFQEKSATCYLSVSKFIDTKTEKKREKILSET